MSINKLYASSEIGTLRRVLIHSPDGGIGKIIPKKAQDWLYEDIVDLDTMREEYDTYVKILLYFLDPEKMEEYHQLKTNENDQRTDFLKPDKEDYFKSDKVVEVQYVLSQILEDKDIRIRLVASICSIERTSYYEQETLLKLNSKDLAKTLVTGFLNQEERFVFPPVPNLIFTRDIGVVINDHLLLTRFAREARYRESLITKYIAYYYFFKGDLQEWKKVIELTEEEYFFLADADEQVAIRSTIEGGDVMMVAPKHLLVGFSERTSLTAIKALINRLFEKQVLDKVTIIQIPQKRDCMHIDTIFTMVKRNCWVLYGPYSKKGFSKTRKPQLDVNKLMVEDSNHEDEAVKIIQYNRHFPENNYLAPKQHQFLEDLFEQICREDFNADLEMQFIYSGDGEFPDNEREQWTDSCNLLAIKEGVVIGYDRNKKTANAFKKVLGPNFRVVKAQQLLHEFEQGITTPEAVENTLILLPSAELSRARGGSHCMSMPLLRDEVGA